MSNVEVVTKERQKVYGSWEPNMRGTSLQLEGLLVQWQANNPGKPLPSWWAPLSMVAVKLNRIASGVYHEDNYTDLAAYLKFVQDMQNGETEVVL